MKSEQKSFICNNYETIPKRWENRSKVDLSASKHCVYCLTQEQ